MERSIIWSYGGGVQTVAIMVLIAQGKIPKPDRTVMANTGRERSSTWRYYTEHVEPIMEDLSMTLEVVSHDVATVDLYAHNGDLLIPAFTTTGRLPTFCSNEWKKFVFRRHLRGIGYGPDKPVTAWMGFSLDEYHRMKKSDVQWCEYGFPLVFDVPKRRFECVNLIKDFGLPEPPKSACWMCPHLNDQEWLDIQTNDPADFSKAIMLDQQIRESDPDVFLHRSRKPLDQAEFDASDLPTLPLFECAESCWT